MLKLLTVLTAAIALGVSSLASAEEGQGRPSKEERLSRMEKHLDLSESQVSQIREIHRNGGGREEVGAVLTEGQRTQVRNHKKHRDQHQRHGSGNGRQGVDSES